MDKWFNVNKDIRVWGGHSDARKQGWIFAPAAVYAVEEYQGSVKFLPEDMMFDALGRIEVKADPGYPEYWVRLEDLSLVPFDLDTPDPIGPDDPAPEPDEVWPTPEFTRPSDETIGRVVRYLLGLT